MSRKTRKTITAAGARLWVALAAATLAGCASAPPSSSADDRSTATLSGPPAGELPIVGCNAASLRQSLLLRVNQARAAGAACGDARQVAAKALVWQPVLAVVATRRASEMAQRGTFGAPDARGTEQRLRQEGYRAVVAQESAAGGDYTSDTVAQTWLSHQQQCLVLTSPQYTDVGAGCANAPGSELGHYWTVVVAKPGDGPAAKPTSKSKPRAKAAPQARPKAAVRGVKAGAGRKTAASVKKASGTSAKKAAAATARKCTTPDCKTNAAVR